MAMTETPSGLQYEDTVAGTGHEATTQRTCVMHYTGWLWTDGAKGAVFDTSLNRGSPFAFRLGTGQVIRGWDEGVAGGEGGGERTPLIPPGRGYRGRGAGGGIPPPATPPFPGEVLEGPGPLVSAGRPGP